MPGPATSSCSLPDFPLLSSVQPKIRVHLLNLSLILLSFKVQCFSLSCYLCFKIPKVHLFQILIITSNGWTGPGLCTTLTTALTILHSGSLHISLLTVVQRYMFIPTQGLSPFPCLDSTPLDDLVFMHLLCSCVIKRSPPQGGPLYP